MKKILFGIFAIVFSMPAMALDVSGTVVDETGAPITGATVYAPGTTKGFTIYENDGSFAESMDVEADTVLEVSFVGCAEQTVKASELRNKTIKLSCSEEIEEVVAFGNFKSRDCTSDELDKVNATHGRWVLGDNGAYCKPSKCKTGFKDNGTTCVSRNGEACTEKELNKWAKKATSGIYMYENGVERCDATACQDGFKLDGVKCIPECDADIDNGIAEQMPIDGKCYPTVCVEPRWVLNGAGTRARCVEQKCNIENGKGAWKKNANGVWECAVVSCNKNFEEVDGQCVSNKCGCGQVFVPSTGKCRDKLSAEKICTRDTKPQLPANAKTAEMVCDANGREYCKIAKDGCADNYYLVESENKCKPKEGTPCVIVGFEGELIGRPQTEYEFVGGALKCVVKKCNDKDYEPNPARTACVQTSGDCDTEDENALGRGKLKNGVCVIQKCKTGFKIQDNSCVTRSGDACTRDELKKYPNATSGYYDYSNGTERCINLKCKDGFKPNEDATECIAKLKKCTPEQQQALTNAKSWGLQDGTENCVALECKCGYVLENGQCREKTATEKKCTRDTKPQLPANAKTAEMVCDANGREYCKIAKDGCNDGFTRNEAKNTCDSKVGQRCVDTEFSGDLVGNPNKEYEYVGGVLKCVVTKCNDKDYKPSEDRKTCVKVSGTCTTDDPYADESKVGTLKQGKCVPNACQSGYNVKDNKCTLTKCKCGYREDGNDCVKREDSDQCTSLTSPASPAHAKYGKYSCPNGENGKEVCLVTEDSCEDGYRADLTNNRCLSLDGFDCGDVADKPADENALKWSYVVSAGKTECRISLCKDDWEPRENGTKCVKVSGACLADDLAKIEHATAGEIRNGKCFATDCEDNYSPNKQGICDRNPCPCGQKLGEGDVCIDKTDEDKVCTLANATKAVLTCEKDKEVCRVVECAKDYEANSKKTRCESVKNDKCAFEGDTKEFVKTARWRERNKKLECVITACTDGYTVDTVKNICIVSEGPCSEEQLKQIENATKGELKKGKCSVTECVPGMEPADNKCVKIAGDCKSMPENAKSAHREFDTESNEEVCVIDACDKEYKVSDDKKTCIIVPGLSREESKKRVEEAQQKYDAAKANEQSLGNRLLGAATMGSMGIGGMMVASSLAEQNADADAELDMAAYLATFKCDYGAGLNIRGGEVNVELPGAAELIPLYSEYVTLANDLKARKNQLGLKAGIESEKILDSATTGLYDDVGVGITSGVYASLARALQDPDGADAKMWAEQKDKSAQNLKTGAITAGVGAVVGIAGNAINKGIIKNREKSKPEAAKKLEEEVANIKPATGTCPSQASGVFPNCVCNSNKEYNRFANECRECTGGRVSQIIEGEQRCACTSDKEFDDGKQQCVDKEKVPECNSEAGEQLQNGECVVVTPEPEEKEEETPTEESFEIVLPVDTMFEIGKSVLRPQVKTSLDAFVTNLTAAGTSKCSDFEVAGYADPAGGKSRNLTLSKERAAAVHDYLMSKSDFKALLGKASTGVIGYGESHCTCGVAKDGIPADKQSDVDYKYCVDKPATAVVQDGVRFVPCRRIRIKMKCTRPTALQSVMDSVSNVSGELGAGLVSGLSTSNIKLN